MLDLIAMILVWFETRPAWFYFVMLAVLLFVKFYFGLYPVYQFELQ